MRNFTQMRLSETFSRRLFIAELIVLVLPSAVVLLPYGAFFAAGSLALIGVALAIPFTKGGPVGRWSDLGDLAQLVGIYGAFAVVAGLGVFALWQFLKIALGFARDGRAALPLLRKTFRTGLLCALLPAAVWGYFVFVGAGGRRDPWLLPVVMSGLPLLVPILHLALELRSAPKAVKDHA